MAEKKNGQFDFGFGEDFSKSFEDSMKDFASFDAPDFGSFDLPDFGSFESPDFSSFGEMKFDFPDMNFSFGEEKKEKPEEKKTGFLSRLFGKKEQPAEPEPKKDPFAIDMGFDLEEFNKQFKFDMPSADDFFAGIMPSETRKTEKLIEKEKRSIEKRERHIRAKAKKTAKRPYVMKTLIAGYYNWAIVWDLLEEERIINMQDKLAERRNNKARGIKERRGAGRPLVAVIVIALIACVFALGKGEDGFSFGNIASKLFETRQNVSELLPKPLAVDSEQRTSVNVPVLMYHHLETKGNDGSSISISLFEDHIKALTEAGYTAILPDELQRYAIRGSKLPDKPIMITFDDGYLSNYQYAYPVLKKYDQKATIFVIGATVGNLEYYKDTNYRITAHFTEAQGKEMVKSGVIMLQSHTYDMHQSKEYDGEGAIIDLVPESSGLTDAEFKDLLIEDIQLERKKLAKMGVNNVHVVAYPYGHVSDFVASVLSAEGFDITFTTEPGDNIVRMGHGEDLLLLKRYRMNDTVDVNTLLSYLEHAGGAEE
ncbi:MAG: polysaccharide deacetylase family protein [Firmicutes bacterium]|nr:polysaccharide deacetylase family protein [Bacillota bacterium]